MQGEMAEQLGYEKHDPEGNNSGNSRNGVTLKTLKGDFGEVEIETPRDRNGEFEPRMVKKNQTRWTGFDDKILSMGRPPCSASRRSRAITECACGSARFTTGLRTDRPNA